MKKMLAIATVLIFMFVSCENGDIIGGRYYGTYKNLLNNKLETGSVSFKYVNNGGSTSFRMNDLIELSPEGTKVFKGIADGASLNDLLKTMPAIDSIQVCENENENIRMMNVRAEFKGNSVKANMEFTTTTEKLVNVEFIGTFE